MNNCIETKRLLIREPKEDDFETVWVMKNDPDVKEFTGGITKDTYEKAFSRHKDECDSFGTNNMYIFSVIEKRTNKYIGYCGFQFCEILKDVEILYGYCKESWGNGYGYEAAKAVLEYGISELKIPRIVAAVNPMNSASEKILQKIGLNYVGKVEWPEQGLVNKYEL